MANSKMVRCLIRMSQKQVEAISLIQSCKRSSRLRGLKLINLPRKEICLHRGLQTSSRAEIKREGIHSLVLRVVHEVAVKPKEMSP